MQMLKVILALAFVAIASAGECDLLTSFKVKAQWSKAFDHDVERTAVGQKVFERFFARFPESQDLFKGVGGGYTNSPAFKAQSVRILASLDSLIGNLDNEPVFNSLVSHLAAQHATRPLKPGYFDEIGKDISDTIRAIVPFFDEQAFAACYARVSAGLSGANAARYYRRRY